MWIFSNFYKYLIPYIAIKKWFLKSHPFVFPLVHKSSTKSAHFPQDLVTIPDEDQLPAQRSSGWRKHLRHASKCQNTNSDFYSFLFHLEPSLGDSTFHPNKLQSPIWYFNEIARMTKQLSLSLNCVEVHRYWFLRFCYEIWNFLRKKN